MILFRYLAKDVFITLIALTSILLLIFMSNQCVQYLNRAASGQFPGMLILKLMMLELPNLAGLLLPLGLYMAFMLSYGRFYAENEMVAMFAGSYSPSKLLMQSLLMGSFVAILVGCLIFTVAPWIALERAKLIHTTGVKTIIQTIAPGHFKSLENGNLVFYVDAMSRNHEKAKHVFLAKLLPDAKWEVVWANEAFGQVNSITQEDELVLKDGRAYIGVPGELKYQVVHYNQVDVRLPHPKSNPEEDIRAIQTEKLWPYFNEDRNKAAELQWRFSVPLMVMVLTLIAVPLSRINPRSGKYANLLPAVLIYVLYANFMFVARSWVRNGKVPVWVGMSWLHLVFIALGLYLVWRNHRKFS